MLISSKLHDKIKKIHVGNNFGILLNNYLKKNNSYFSNFKPKNFEDPKENTKIMTRVLNKKNKLLF